MPFRLCRSILRRWPNAAAVRRSNVLAIDALGHRRGTTWTTAEVTLGGGTKAERCTAMAIRASQRHWAATDRRP